MSSILLYFKSSSCQENGIWAWDPKTNSLVLLIVCVLALLGDNPMQSEFACHIGLRGKFFCRTCWVKGKDAKVSNTTNSAAPPSADINSSDDNNEESETGSLNSAASITSKGKKKKKHTRFKESLQTMIGRVKAFVKVSLFHVIYISITANFTSLESHVPRWRLYRH